jgi:hypothetical protein
MNMANTNILQLIKEGYSFKHISEIMNFNEQENNVLSKELLLKLFKQKKSFKLIGEYLEVPDKTVKDWFKKYNLPTTVKDMKKLI